MSTKSCKQILISLKIVSDKTYLGRRPSVMRSHLSASGSAKGKCRGFKESWSKKYRLIYFQTWRSYAPYTHHTCL